MKKVFLFTVFSVLTLLVQAQTFICTDYQLYGSKGHSVSASEVQRRKNEYLGTKFTLTFYDNSVRLADSKESLILDKSSSNADEYFCTNKKKYGSVEKFVLKLNKTVGYIRSLTLMYYYNNKLEGKVTLKRD